jgi:hypothetical protein
VGQDPSNPGTAIQPKVEMDIGGVRPGLIFGDEGRVYTLANVRSAVQRVGPTIRWFEPAFDPGV